MDKKLDIGKILGGGALIILFLFREAIAWLLGEILSVLPIPRDAEGNIAMNAIPWSDIVAWLVLITGVVFVVWGIIGKRHRSNGDEVADIDTIDDPRPPANSVTAEQITPIIDARLEEFLATKLRAEFVTNRQQHGYDEKLVDLGRKIKAARDAVSGIENKLDRLVEYSEKTYHDADRRFDWVDSGFKAILHREQMTFQAEMIEELATKLLRVRDGKPIENWGEWTTQQNRWMSGISSWLELAEKYRAGCRARILTVEPDTLLGDWPEPEDAFPSTDAMMAYRRVAVTLGQFRLEQKAADDAVKIAAYGSPSKKSPLGG